MNNTSFPFFWCPGRGFWLQIAVASDFDKLQPDVILRAIELAGFNPTGEYAQLNSYENRVFDIRLEISSRAPHPTDRIIAKFYRPHRWSREALQDEHDFLHDLQREGIPAIAPLPLKNGATLFQHEGYWVVLFPRVLGRMPQEFLGDQLQQVGRTLARIHNIGARKRAQHRPALDADTYGWKVLPRLERFVYPELWRPYREVAEFLLHCLEEDLDPSTYIRIHGDCHRGNLLHSGQEFFFVDFDDFCMGPVEQDFWMLCGETEGERAQEERDKILSGYEELRDAPQDWHLLEPLRALRILNYAAWIAQRWNDPFFKQIFPAFETYNYWVDELRTLEKIAHQL